MNYYPTDTSLGTWGRGGDRARPGVIGHSMGGSGAISAAQQWSRRD
jgi:S-formylglutathione hydrolase FrmB